MQNETLYLWAFLCDIKYDLIVCVFYSPINKEKLSNHYWRKKLNTFGISHDLRLYMIFIQRFVWGFFQQALAWV